MLKRVIFKASRTSLKIIIFYILFSRENVFVFLLFSVFIFIFADAVSISLKKNYAINHNEGLVITISNKPSLTPSLCIEASVPSQESERPFMCVLVISILTRFKYDLSIRFWNSCEHINKQTKTTKALHHDHNNYIIAKIIYKQICALQVLTYQIRTSAFKIVNIIVKK